MKIKNNEKLLNEYIKRHNINNILPNLIDKEVELVQVEGNEDIFLAGNNLDYYYLLVEGMIKISYPVENGKEMPLKYYKNFGSVGDVEVLVDEPILCNITSITNSLFIRVPVKVIKKYYLKNEVFLLYTSQILAEKIRATIKNNSYNYVYPLINRLATYLIITSKESDRFEIKISFKELAKLLGTSYRHLNRVLGELRDNRLISIDKKEICIINRKDLEDLSKEEFVNSF